MGWAAPHIAKLREGQTVSFRPIGHSMVPLVVSGQLCTVEPVDARTLKVDDVVLCKVKQAEYLHLVKAIDRGRYQIGNNRGRINGWIDASRIYGKLVKVEP